MSTPKIPSEVVQSCLKKFRNVDFSKSRKNIYKEKPFESSQSLYQIAKFNQTKIRNLEKALVLYTQAALNGQRINSCIKDFASVLHQGGYTYEAIKFLQQMKENYKGDSQKYEKLIQNLSIQLCPTGKHQYKYILIDLVDLKLQNTETQILKMFSNSSRIKSVKVYADLGFRQQRPDGKYVAIQFDSFSAAKKTLQTFDQSQWFGVNKFWMDYQFYIVAQAINGRTDFDHGFLMNKGYIQKIDGKCSHQSTKWYRLPNYAQFIRLSGLQLKNSQSMFLMKYFNDSI